MSKPNIIFILSDQHRFDWMGCAGTEFTDTPNMDRLAAAGIRFSHTSCNAPLCGPSRMSMLTGRHQYRNGVYINEHCLSSDVPTIAHSLGLGGYETLLCGRMHFMGPDQRHGFENRIVGDICRCYPGAPMTEYKGIEGAASSIKKAIEHAGPRDTPVLQYDRAVTDGFEQFIEKRDDERPLFATVGYYGPHRPWSAPPEFYEKAAHAMEGKDRIIPFEGEYHPWFKDRLEQNGEPLTPLDRVEEIRANYAGMISYLDTLIGKVLKAAEQLPGETLVVYSSDHGDMVGDRGLYGKCSFYETSLNVPLIFAPLKGSVEGLAAEPGTVVEYNTSLIDLAPTLTEFTGSPDLPIQDGDSLEPFLRGEKPDNEFWKNREIFSELELLRKPPIRMILKDKLKLNYYHTFDEVELYDIKADPDENVNLADNPDYAIKKKELITELMKGWDPDWMMKDIERKMDDLDFMAHWGRTVGVKHLGKSELWDQPGVAKGEEPLS